jgi:hypothetical protein
MLLDDEVLDETRLNQVLSAARRPAEQHELGGLSAARSAFVSTYTPALSARRAPGARPLPRTSVAARLLALKAAAVVSGATLIGGVAFAASNSGLLDLHPSHQRQNPAPQASHGLLQRSGDGSLLVPAQLTSSTVATAAQVGGAAKQTPPGQAQATHPAHGRTTPPPRSPHPRPSNTPPTSPPGQTNSEHPNKGHSKHPKQTLRQRETAPAHATPTPHHI